MPQHIPTTLLQELMRAKIVSEAEIPALEETVKNQDKDLGQILIEQGSISDKDLAALKSKLYRLPVADFDKIDFNREVLKEMEENVVEFYKITPFQREGDVL